MLHAMLWDERSTAASSPPHDRLRRAEGAGPRHPPREAARLCGVRVEAICRRRVVRRRRRRRCRCTARA
jgi:hypothetical protein